MPSGAGGTYRIRGSNSPLPGVVVSGLGGRRKHSTATATLAAVNSASFADLGNAPAFSDTLVQVETA